MANKFYTYCDRVGSKIFHRYVDHDGKRKMRAFSDYPFELFIKGKTDDAKSLFGDRLSRVEFPSVNEMADFVREYKDVTEVFGQTSPVHQFIAKEYPGNIQFDISKFVVLNLDCEIEHRNGFPKPESANDTIISISMKVFDKDQRITLGLKPYKAKNNDVYEHCEDERQLLTKFIHHWKRIQPDIITGWNIEGFDIPYLVNRISKVLGEEFANQLSPFYHDTKRVLIPIEVGKQQDQPSYRILGINIFDYYNLYAKFAPQKLESYKLDFVAEVELGANKVDLSPWGGSLMRLYDEDFDTFIEYNEKDVELVEKLDEKLKFIQLTVQIALMTHSRYSEALASVKPWDNMLYNMLLERNIQIPPENFDHESDGIIGAYVKDSVPGKYNWIVSLDLNSLYPSIIRMYNMSPETLIKGASENPTKFMETMLAELEGTPEPKISDGNVIAANGSVYSQDYEGILPHAMSYLFNERKRVKKEMLVVKQVAEDTKDPILFDKAAQLDALQLALKVVANSGYGAAANRAFRYFSTDIAEGITLTGQLTIRFIADKVNKFLNAKFKTDQDWVVIADTDSLYITLDKFVNDVLKITPEKQKALKHKIVDCIDMFVKKEIEPILEKEFSILAKYVGAKNNYMVMKREAISDVCIIRGKKNYIMQVYDNEGVRYKEPKLKAMGVETARSSTPKIVREELKRCLNTLLNETNDVLMKELEQFKARFMSEPLSKVASPRGVTEINKWGDGVPGKGTPIHVKAAMFYNELVKKKGLDKERPLIREGDKIKFIYLKTPNPIQSSAIGFIDELPTEFGLDKYVDRETQFEKTFLSPLRSFTDLIGWHTEKRSSLDDLWS